MTEVYNIMRTLCHCHHSAIKEIVSRSVSIQLFKLRQSIPILKKVIRLYIIFVNNDPIIKEELIESIRPLLLTDLYSL